MKKITLSACFIFALFLLNGCIINIDDDQNDCIKGKGGFETRTYSLPEFSALDLSMSANVFVIQGSDQEVTVQGQSNILDELDLYVAGDELRIGLESGCFKSFDKPIFNITVGSLRAVEVTGSGDVLGQSLFEAGSFIINVSGSGDVSLDLSVDELTTSVSGSGSVELDGNAIDQSISVSGSGRVRAFDLITDDTSVQISGSGSAEVFASDNLTGSISGSGTIFYKGTPNVNIAISGSGNVNNAN